MRRPMLLALIAATLLTPVAAIAQDRPNRGDRPAGAEGQRPRGERPQSRAQRPPERQAPRPDRAAVRPQEYRGGASGRQPVERRRIDPSQIERRSMGTPRTIAQGRPDGVRVDRDRQDDRGVTRREYRAGGDNSRRWNDQRGWDGNRRDGSNDRRNWSNDRRDWDDRRDGNRARGFVDRRDWNNGRGRGDDRGWNRGWRAESRYDWRAARYRNRAAYHLPRYYAPRGWGYGYQRFGIGASLSSLLWAQSYWLDDPYAYRLPPAWGPFRWVRYYDDALLVDTRTGEVVDVEYGIFW